MSPRERGGPLCIGSLWVGISAAFRGLFFVLFRRFRPSRDFGGFVLLPALRFGIGSHRLLRLFRVIRFLVSRLAFGLLWGGGFVFVFSYSGASYGDHSSELTTF